MRNYETTNAIAASNIKDYTETAMNAIEKLRDEYFFIAPPKFDDELMTQHMDMIINSYDYIAFMVSILDDAIKHIDSHADAILNSP